MEIWTLCLLIAFLLTATAKPEIPSKGKHTAVLDAHKQGISNEDNDMPRFAEPIANVTVSVGRDALLACVVENLKGYKVAWVRVDTQTILSIHHNLISQNSRISLTYNDHRSWYLHIKDVEESDRGWYMCQINTDPMRSRKGYLQVVVPPMIVEGMTSNDLVVREGLNVTLVCKARGYPEPYVMWRREDGEEMLIGGEHVNVVDGELLHITKVSRLHMAAYLCVASNGVPPSISKRVHLRVQFPPMLSIPNQLEGAYIGQDVVLECHTEAYPASINYWTTERGDMIISDTSRAGDKYETTSAVSGYTKFMKLKIRSVGPNDFGTYRCVAKNSLGETDGNIKLDEMPTPTTAIISEIALWNRSIDGKRRNRNKFDLNALPDYGVEEWRDGAGNGGLNSGNTIHGDGSDNNQTPVRNPPGAFHNSAGGGLAQYNLLGRIIHGIKMQSFGIFQRLSSYFVTKRIENMNDAGGMNRKIKRSTESPQAYDVERQCWWHQLNSLLFTNQMIVSLALNEETTVLHAYVEYIPKTLVNMKKSNTENDYTCSYTSDYYVDDTYQNNKILLYAQASNNNDNKCNKTNIRQHKQEKQRLTLLGILNNNNKNNTNVNMRRIITSIRHWPKASISNEGGVGGNIYTTFTTTVTSILASLLPLSPTMLVKLICIIIFFISIMLLLLHLIIDSNNSHKSRQRSSSSSSCCKNTINTSHNNTIETHNTTPTKTTIPTTYPISENRLLPLSAAPVLALDPPTPTPTRISPLFSSFSSSTHVSHTKITFSLRKQQQKRQFKATTTTTTTKTIITSIAVYTYPLALTEFFDFIPRIFHLVFALR